jgi:hypothetical protein
MWAFPKMSTLTTATHMKIFAWPSSSLHFYASSQLPEKIKSRVGSRSILLLVELLTWEPTANSEQDKRTKPPEASKTATKAIKVPDPQVHQAYEIIEKYAFQAVRIDDYIC